jgi:TfoX/Sxy family transcriptional regulator of competence genes
MAVSAESQRLLDELAVDYLGNPGVSRGRMFASEGLKVNGKIFAFIGSDNRLIVKVPADRVLELVDNGTAERLTQGRRTMREWVTAPLAAAPLGAERWAALVAESFAYVSGSRD